MGPSEFIIPLLGAAVAALSSLVKNRWAKNSEHEIVINLGNGSQVTLDGSEESRERVRKLLSTLIDSPKLSETDGPTSRTELANSNPGEPAYGTRFNAEGPVVGKVARVVEEVTLGKGTTEHMEATHETVRHTGVEVEQVTGEATSTSSRLNRNRF